MKTLEDRFWEKVDKKSDDECWEWQASRNYKGYGEFWFSGRGGKKTRAHQISWILNNGDIPDGLFVCHHCDNPGCVNPKHLWLGTNRDNILDAKRKGRLKRENPLCGTDHSQYGTKHWANKLTEDNVREIRKLCKGGKHTFREIGKMFGVTQGLINNIKHGRKWAWLED